MKVRNLKCPNCGASLNRELIGNLKNLFCPYCGQQLSVNDEYEQITINKNININKAVDIQYSKRTTNDADVIRAIYESKDNRKSWIVIVVMFIILIALVATGVYSSYDKSQRAKAAEAAGKVNVGWYGDFKDKNYKAVVSQLEVLGFENIETIDLNDAGWFSNKSDTIATISINGKSDFYNVDYFFPTDKVIITYH